MPASARTAHGVPWRRVVVAGVVAAATLSALTAIGILLLGHFGETEGRVLATTALLALAGVLAFPGAILLDQRRAPVLPRILLPLVGVWLVLAVALTWSDGAPEALGKAMGTVLAFTLAAAQTALLVARGSDRDPRAVGLLRPAAAVLAVMLAAAVSVVLWAELDSQLFARLFGSGLVLDLLLVALQPLLAAARPPRRSYRLRLRLAEGGVHELDVEADSLGAAVRRAIARAAVGDDEVVAIERVELGVPGPPSSTRSSNGGAGSPARPVRRGRT